MFIFIMLYGYYVDTIVNIMLVSHYTVNIKDTM